MKRNGPDVAFHVGTITLIVIGSAIVVWVVGFDSRPLWNWLSGAVGAAAAYVPISKIVRRPRHRNRGAANDAKPRVPPTPPRLACVVLAALAKPEHRQAYLGDVLEQFEANVRRFGLRRARWLCTTDALASLAPLVWTALKRIGIVGALVAGAKRLFG